MQSHTLAERQALSSSRLHQFNAAGVDVVFDPVGGKQLGEALKSVKWGAQYLVIGFAGEPAAA